MSPSVKGNKVPLEKGDSPLSQAYGFPAQRKAHPMGAFSRRLDKGVTGEPCSPLRISVFKKGKILLFLRWWNAVPAAFPADRTASGFPVRFHAPDALSNRESTGLLRFSTSVSTACGKLKEKKIPSQQFICIAGKSAVWNLLWRIVE